MECLRLGQSVYVAQCRERRDWLGIDFLIGPGF